MVSIKPEFLLDSFLLLQQTASTEHWVQDACISSCTSRLLSSLTCVPPFVHPFSAGGGAQHLVAPLLPLLLVSHLTAPAWAPPQAAVLSGLYPLLWPLLVPTQVAPGLQPSSGCAFALAFLLSCFAQAVSFFSQRLLPFLKHAFAETPHGSALTSKGQPLAASHRSPCCPPRQALQLGHGESSSQPSLLFLVSSIPFSNPYFGY